MIELSTYHIRDLAETIESGPLSIKDLFKNKSVAYFLLFHIKFFITILALYYANFQFRRKNIISKYKKIALKKLQKPPKKVAYLWQLGGFLISASLSEEMTCCTTTRQLSEFLGNVCVRKEECSRFYRFKTENDCRHFWIIFFCSVHSGILAWSLLLLNQTKSEMPKEVTIVIR